ncbi:MAG TPA: EamA/RhaT family transporter [Flavobacteriales bacterium]|nr:EamA/RhaT family transporter [Flavobacteriales bacterium]
MNKKLYAHFFLVVANLIYGASYTIAKEAMPEYVQPFGFILIRVIGAVLLFWTLRLFVSYEKVDNKDYLKLAICGLFGVAINQMLFFKGLSMTTPINAAIIMTCNPVMVLLFSALLIKESITIKKSIGIVLGISGAIILILGSVEASFSQNSFNGDLFVYINATSYALYLVLVKPLMKKYQPITIITWIFTFGLFYVFPFGIQEMLNVEWYNLPLTIWGAILFIVVLTTCVAYLINVSALKHLSPTTVSYYIYLQPLFAAIVAIGFGKDYLNLNKLSAAALIFAGVYLVSTGAKSGQKKEVQ